jgi:hypothetical protein
VNGIQFGTFEVAGVTPTETDFNSDFSMTVSQTLPSIASGPISGTITGSVQFYDNELSLTVTGGSLHLSGGGSVTSDVVYTLYSGNIGNNIGADATFDAPVYGSIGFTSSVPLPASVLSGTALLGGMFLTQLRKRSKMA